jgi:hypothetical protein
LADWQDRIDGRRPIRLHRNGRYFLALEAFVRERQCVGSDRQVYEVVGAVRVGLLGAREFRLIRDNRDHSFRQNTTGFVRDGARDPPSVCCAKQ